MEVITGDHNGWVLVSLSFRSERSVSTEHSAESEYTEIESKRIRKTERRARIVANEKHSRRMRRAVHQYRRQFRLR